MLRTIPHFVNPGPFGGLPRGGIRRGSDSAGVVPGRRSGVARRGVREDRRVRNLPRAQPVIFHIPVQQFLDHQLI